MERAQEGHDVPRQSLGIVRSRAIFEHIVTLLRFRCQEWRAAERRRRCIRVAPQLLLQVALNVIELFLLALADVPRLKGDKEEPAFVLCTCVRSEKLVTAMTPWIPGVLRRGSGNLLLARRPYAVLKRRQEAAGQGTYSLIFCRNEAARKTTPRKTAAMPMITMASIAQGRLVDEDVGGCEQNYR